MMEIILRQSRSEEQTYFDSMMENILRQSQSENRYIFILELFDQEKTNNFNSHDSNVSQLLYTASPQGLQWGKV